MVARQGMMVYLISCPDQVKNKILASFVCLCGSFLDLDP
jgi:hypothetical protein